ncbi:thiamine diphosphokinase [Vallitalea sp.]|jgi:thiamine pyrophosphokinase|uniref:thiamine diphosphokinase n=1 Tax=Vallitalea sp. TaxID=1882829 RepID=UPI0025CBAD1C|nr:thiamine diphosphokinase [Vallitalea sp.]MCT4687374.1 thiamine diphosphokinase [Vallitalea sp.]
MKTLIVTGGTIDLTFLKNCITSNQYDYIIGVDKGAQYLFNAGIQPNLIVGDFDSISQEVINELTKEPSIKVNRFIAEKDETDTHLAIMEAIHIGSTHIDLFGGIGTRMDHTIANIHILMIPLEKRIKCRIINNNNIISLIDKTTYFFKNDYKYISLIPLTNTVIGISTKGLKYELNGYTMKQGISIGISNEFIKDKATVSLTNGILIVIRSRD